MKWTQHPALLLPLDAVVYMQSHWGCYIQRSYRLNCPYYAMSFTTILSIEKSAHKSIPDKPKGDGRAKNTQNSLENDVVLQCCKSNVMQHFHIAKTDGGCVCTHWHLNRLNSEKSWSCINFVVSRKYFKPKYVQLWPVVSMLMLTLMVRRHCSLLMETFSCHPNWNTWNRFTNHLNFNRFHGD